MLALLSNFEICIHGPAGHATTIVTKKVVSCTK